MRLNELEVAQLVELMLKMDRGQRERAICFLINFVCEDDENEN